VTSRLGKGKRLTLFYSVVLLTICEYFCSNPLEKIYLASIPSTLPPRTIKEKWQQFLDMNILTVMWQCDSLRRVQMYLLSSPSLPLAVTLLKVDVAVQKPNS
jgi:hypothetical protein